MILALDTCLGACSVALVSDGGILAHASEAMARGHQERLAPMVERVLAEAGVPPGVVTRVAVPVGPGSFTGLRVGIAFAKGFAQALGAETVGVGVLEALAAEADGLVCAAIDARRDQVYLQVLEDGVPLMAPDVLPIGTAAARLAEITRGRSLTLAGSGAALLADAAPGARIIPAEGCDARRVARIAATRGAGPLIPLYLRAPDAKLPAARA
ncbi:MAG: tRNA (adenosine(37)-N6)-threonylcarbamoyltransferase complex dimerization subunit type 1 TsaB [Phenylobacterium sp.]